MAGGPEKGILMPTHPMMVKARATGNPLIEGEKVTFLWQGKDPPFLIDDLHNWDECPQPMVQIGAMLWSYSLLLASDAYYEYAFVDPRSGERLVDPLNSNRVWNGVNAYNQYLYMPNGSPTPLVRKTSRIAAGIVTHHECETKEYIVGKKRVVYLYQPPVEEPVPLVIVYDGVDYLKRARLNVMVDNLIAANRIKPFAMAMLQNGKQARSLEYACSDSTLGFVSECVLPLAQENLNLLSPGTEPYGVLGASMGGLMSLYTGLRLPHIFAKVICQSGVYILPEFRFVVVDLVNSSPPPAMDIWMDVGRYESLLENNRQMVGLLQDKKYRVNYHEFSGGHNFTSWRNALPLGLEHLFR